MAQMLYQNETRTLKTLSAKFPVVAIIGPRGNAKARLVRSVFPSKDYIDLRNENILKLAQKSFRTFLLAFPKGAIINDAGKIPTLVDDIRYYVDKWGYEPGRYILVSSGKIDISHLQDRGICMNLISPSVEDLDKAALLSENPFMHIHKGQYPAVIEGLRSYQDILGSCLKRDFARHINSASFDTFQKFLRSCAASSARPLSMNRMARELGVSAPTVKTWIALLKTYGIATQLQSKDSSDNRIFLNDSGLMCHLLDIETKESLILSPFRDQVVSTYALSEILKGRYSKAMESGLSLSETCDFTTDWKTRFNIFVDSSIEVTSDVIRRAKTVSETDRESKTVILYLGDVTFSKGKIDCIGYRDWTKFASGIDYFS